MRSAQTRAPYSDDLGNLPNTRVRRGAYTFFENFTTKFELILSFKNLINILKLSIKIIRLMLV